eukprot:TRINITY_DN8428_c0_g1_i1.p1 TRINITY_DN8428_c0_g1~~TRINITY_DN8428_c0_g1_i1.p1  ORF type:complete len:210 (-),score=22.10 TRINITY_DN8428_c0_g1_i1:366-914(-)
MPVSYPDLEISIKNTFLDFSYPPHGVKKRSSSWSGAGRYSERDAVVRGDVSLASVGCKAVTCSGEAPTGAEHSQHSVHMSRNSLPLLATTPGDYSSPSSQGQDTHHAIQFVAEDRKWCPKCKGWHLSMGRPNKQVRMKIKKRVLEVMAVQDEAHRIQLCREIAMQDDGGYACRLLQSYVDMA